jgi:hypothetical protein
VLSRDSTARLFNLAGLREEPVTIDWFKKEKGVLLGKETIAVRIAEEVQSGSDRIGVMLHHAVADRCDLAATASLIALLAEHPSTRQAMLQQVANGGT